MYIKLPVDLWFGPVFTAFGLEIDYLGQWEVGLTFLGPKKWHSPNARRHFTGPNPLPLARVMDLSASKALRMGLYQS
jgi:hypothetical protein